jgi:membrane protease YdiL (CAAX protease family)
VNLIWFDHLFFFVVGIVLPLFSYISSQAMKDIDEEDLMSDHSSKKDLYYSNGLMLWIGALLVTTNYVMSGKPFERLGFSWPKIDTFVIGLTVTLSLVYIIDTYFSVRQYRKEKSADDKTIEMILPKNWSEYKHYAFLAISAGICEEIVYRAFLINYLKELLAVGPSNIFFAILIPSVIFALSHLYQGWLNVLKIFTISLLFGNIYVFSESLLIVIILHVLVDLVSGTLLIFNKEKNQSTDT